MKAEKTFTVNNGNYRAKFNRIFNRLHLGIIANEKNQIYKKFILRKKPINTEQC